MNVAGERSRSPWMDTPAPRLDPLAQNAEADVLVIGAGIAGLSVAYELTGAGRGVTVVDRGRFGRGMTARTTAHLAFELDDYFHRLIKSHGRNLGQLWRESQAAAVDRIEEIAAREGIACDFARVDGYLVPARPEDVSLLRKELIAAREAGIVGAEWVEASRSPAPDQPALRFPRQARMHPLKYLDGLTAVLQARGAHLYDRTAITALDEQNGWIVATTEEGHRIRAGQVVVATNTPFHLKIPIHTKQAPYRTYALAAAAPKSSVPDILLWDTDEPGYHYVRLQPGEGEDLLIVGGEDHKSGMANDGAARIARLEAWMRARYPQVGDVRHAWSGQVYEPADTIAFVGRSPEHHEVYLVTGDSGQGMTTGAMAGMLLRDLMADADNPWARLYTPLRQMHRGLGEYVKENVEAARHWVELATVREVDAVGDIPAGEGALMRVEGKPVGVYRDETGDVKRVSAACTHAGCVVHWNSFERCWDCPCHGSQFSPEGEVLNGPAASALAPLDDEHRRDNATAAARPTA